MWQPPCLCQQRAKLNCHSKSHSGKSITALMLTHASHGCSQPVTVQQRCSGRHVPGTGCFFPQGREDWIEDFEYKPCLEHDPVTSLIFYSIRHSQTTFLPYFSPPLESHLQCCLMLFSDSSYFPSQTFPAVHFLCRYCFMEDSVTCKIWVTQHFENETVAYLNPSRTMRVSHRYKAAFRSG